MKKLLFGSLLCFLLPALSGCIKEPQPDDGRQKAVLAAVEKVRKALSDDLGVAAPTLNVLIQTPTEKLFVSATAPSEQPITANTNFRFASNTKNFTATAILNMWEDGWLDYKAKITDIVPESKDFTYVPLTPDWDFPNKNEITIEQLLQHSAGVFDVDNDPVPGYGGLSYTEAVQTAFPDHQFTTEEMVKVLQDKVLPYFAPGTDHHYSNTGYSLLAEIIKRVYSYKSGVPKTFSDYLEDYIVGGYAPVPLKSLHFPVRATDKVLPAPHLTSIVYAPNGIERYNDYNMSGQVGEGNGYGTMNDLNTHIRTLMKGQNALKPATVHLMQHTTSPGNDQYALGTSFVTNLGYGHNGARIGYLSAMFYDPVYDVSVVSMTNIWDLRDGMTSFLKVYNAVQDAAYQARQVLGYPGRP